MNEEEYKRMLITGVWDFIGRHLTRKFAENNYSGDDKFIKKIKKIVNETDIPTGGYPKKYSRVLIPMLTGVSHLFVIREGLIAHALRLRGAESVILLCDEKLPACDSRSKRSENSNYCEYCRECGQKYLDAFKLPYYKISQFIKDEQRKLFKKEAETVSKYNIFDYERDGFMLGRHVWSSTLRYFMSGGIDIEDEETERIARAFLYSALVMHAASKRAINEIKPDKIFSSHGIYIQWGIIYDLAKKMSIPIDTYGGGFRKNTLYIYHNRRAVPPYVDDIFVENLNNELTQEQYKILDDYLATRETNYKDILQYHRFVQSDKKKILNEIGLPCPIKGKIVGMFTNIAWDGVLLSNNYVFNSMFEWIDKTINYFINKPTYHLIIKAHPAEIKHVEKTPEKWQVKSHIQEHYNNLPKNIHLIGPESKISTFSLYDLIDFGIVHVSTVGFEMALQGKIVLTSGCGAHYSSKGFTIDPVSQEDYFKKLDRLLLGEEKLKPDVKSARKYAYSMFFQKPISFDLIDLDMWTVKSINVNNLKELLPNKNINIDIICEGILNDKPYKSPMEYVD